MQVIPSILIPVFIDAIAVLGLYIIAAGGRLSAGHAAFFGIGGYASGLLSIHLGLPLLLSLLFGLAAAAFVGAIFAVIADRLSHWFFAIATVALAVMVEGLVSAIEPLGGATGLYGIPISVGLTEVSLSLVLTLAFVIWFDTTRFSRTLRASRDSDIAAQSLGINLTVTRAIAYASGTALAGLAGGLWSHYIGLIKPYDISLEHSLLYLVYLSIGGAEVWLGALAGTFLLSLMPEIVRFSQEYRLAVFGGLLTVFMIVRPAGLISKADVNRTVKWLRKLFGKKPKITRSGIGQSLRSDTTNTGNT